MVAINELHGNDRHTVPEHLSQRERVTPSPDAELLLHFYGEVVTVAARYSQGISLSPRRLSTD